MTPDALSALHQRCFSVPRPFSAAEFTALLAAPHNFLVAGAHGFALGQAVAGEAELLTLAVDPDCRRAGHGRRLLQRFEARAVQRDAGRVFLEVAADNTAGRQLYLAAGYRESGRRRGYYRPPVGAPVDAIVMDKDLRPLRDAASGRNAL